MHRILLLLFSLVLSACSGLVPKADEGPFVAPAASQRPVQATAAPSLTSPVPTTFPTSTPACTNHLTFLEDQTVPDGTAINPGSEIDKRWLVENSGTCNWDERYRLRLVAGPELGAAQEQALFPARSGTEASIRILFTAPSEPGGYRSAWQAFSPEGEPFGDLFFIDFVVQGP